MKKLGLMFVLTVFLFSAEQDEIPLLKWAGPPGSRPESYEEWIEQHPYTDFSCILNRTIHSDGRTGTIAIFTEQNIASALTNEIDQLATNLQSEGYDVLSYQTSGGNPDTFRQFIKDLYDTNNIEGVLLVGDIPAAWFEIADDFNQYGYADFPCDLFYMDLDGTWLDTMNTGNGKYDGHTGTIEPEIYVGRLVPSGIGDDTLLLENYFRKNNAYRHDTLLLTQRALVFVDDDWIPWAGQWAYDISLLYPDTMNYWDPETTRASVYRTKLDTTQAWVSVFAHSWPGGHQFTYNSGSNHDNYYSYEYINQDPPTNFYNFFACSFSRYTTAGNCGGSRAIFNQNYGLGSIGSTKTGSMLDFYFFYRPLGQNKTLGEAFKDWFTHITNYGVTFDELCWHYGMVLLADPFLKPTGHNMWIAETESNTIPNSMLTISGNPGLTHINLHMFLEQSADVQIDLYNCAGRKVNNIKREFKAGNNKIKLQLNNKTGENLPKGVYILRVNINKKIITKKIIKI